MIRRMTAVAARDGLDFRFDKIRPGNTFDAHRVLHLAGELGQQGALKERFFRAYLTEGAPIGDPETLVRLAGEVGLDPDHVRAVLASDSHAREVRADEEAARELGISGVPFFVLGGKVAVSGAQPTELLLGALQRAWGDGVADSAVSAEGANCSPDGCA